MIGVPFIRPSYQTDFAHSAGESEYPDLWRGLIGAWEPVLGHTGSIVRDLGSTRIDGTLAAVSQWAVGERGPYLSFDGSQTVEIGTLSDFDFITGAPLTLVAWARNRSSVSNRGLVGKWTGNTGFLLFISATDVVTWQIDGSGSRVNGTITRDVWHHIVSILTPGLFMEMWIDGVSVGTDTANAMRTSLGNLELGGYNGANNWTGDLSDVRLYNRVWTANEVLQDFRVSSPSPFVLRPRLLVKAPAAVGPTVPDQTLAPTSQMTNSGGMVGGVIMKRRDRIYVPEELHG